MIINRFFSQPLQRDQNCLELSMSKGVTRSLWWHRIQKCIFLSEIQTPSLLNEDECHASTNKFLKGNKMSVSVLTYLEEWYYLNFNQGLTIVFTSFWIYRFNFCDTHGLCCFSFCVQHWQIDFYHKAHNTNFTKESLKKKTFFPLANGKNQLRSREIHCEELSKFSVFKSNSKPQWHRLAFCITETILYEWWRGLRKKDGVKSEKPRYCPFKNCCISWSRHN